MSAIEDVKSAVEGALGKVGGAGQLPPAKLLGGARVAIVARRRDRLESLASRISDDGGRAVPIAVDVADEDSARGFVSKAHSEHIGALPVNDSSSASSREAEVMSCL